MPEFAKLKERDLFRAVYPTEQLRAVSTLLLRQHLDFSMSWANAIIFYDLT
jgi:hypothetical protein